MNKINYINKPLNIEIIGEAIETQLIIMTCYFIIFI